MQTNELLDLLHRPSSLEPDTNAFIAQLRSVDITGQSDLFARLAHSACLAGSQANAVIAGHQVAVRRLFPTTPGDAVTAFCVSEAKGPHPRYIATALDQQDGEFTITGEKMWGTMAPAADVLYVAASIGEQDGQNQLRMVAVPTDQASIKQIALPPERQAGDVPICDLKFEAAAVSQVFEQDAYTHYIKPFRLIEDVFSTVAMQVALYRAGADTGLSHEAREDLLGLIIQGQAVAESDMTATGTILLLTSYLRSSQLHWQNMQTQPSSYLAPYWHFDKPILRVAERARLQRRATAWQTLGETVSI